MRRTRDVFYKKFGAVKKRLVKYCCKPNENEKPIK
jgi:hypothetical protein